MNDEDIKVLEKLIKDYEKSGRLVYVIDKTDKEAIENLIKGYKELKEENQMLRKVNKIAEGVTVKDVEKAILNANNELKENYIEKSKIKEKIEELEKEIEEKQENCLDFTLIHEYEIDTNGIIKVLQELLQEGDDK